MRKNLVKFENAVFQICEQTDLTDRQTYPSQYVAPIPNFANPMRQ